MSLENEGISGNANTDRCVDRLQSVVQAATQVTLARIRVLLSCQPVLGIASIALERDANDCTKALALLSGIATVTFCSIALEQLREAKSCLQNCRDRLRTILPHTRYSDVVSAVDNDLRRVYEEAVECLAADQRQLDHESKE